MKYRPPRYPVSLLNHSSTYGFPFFKPLGDHITPVENACFRHPLLSSWGGGVTPQPHLTLAWEYDPHALASGTGGEGTCDPPRASEGFRVFAGTVWETLPSGLQDC